MKLLLGALAVLMAVPAAAVESGQIERLAASHRLRERFWPVEDIILSLAIKSPPLKGVPASMLPEFPPEAEPGIPEEVYYEDFSRAIEAEQRGDPAIVAAYVRDRREIAGLIAVKLLQTNPANAPKTELTPFERRFMDGLMLHVGNPETPAFKRYQKLMFEDLSPLAAAPNDGGIRERRIAMWRIFVREQVELYYSRIGTQDGTSAQRLEKEWDLRDRLARQMFTDDRVLGGAPQPASAADEAGSKNFSAGIIALGLLASVVMLAIGAFLLRRNRHRPFVGDS